ncbi:MAG: replication factor C large subunit [Thermoplasmata archaeon]|nr:replication factor C large subunit [Thermoplasmata archaeon]
MVKWTEKYRPKRLDDIIGNSKVKEDLLKWANSWQNGPPKKRAVVLMGDPGIGKTTAALALANDLGWQVVEMNASDSRNAEAVKNVALLGAMGETFSDTGEFISSKEGQRKLIVLDEADNVFGREDFGGVRIIAQIIINTRQPVILIVNDWYALKKRSSVIGSKVITLSFTKPRSTSIAKVLRFIANNEDLTVSDEVIRKMSERSGGDVRSAINDLQSLAIGRNTIELKDISTLGDRDVSSTIFKSLATVFHTGNCKRSREAFFNLDENPEMLILWVDQNITNAYRDPRDVYAAYDALSRADIYLGRVKRKQYYGLWGYANDMMTCGVSLAKTREYRGYVKYQFPSWLSKMSRSKGMRDARDGFAARLGKHTHSSGKMALQELLPYFRQLYVQDREFQLTMTKRLNLTEEQVGFLLEAKPDSHKVKHVFDAIRKVEAVSRPSKKDDEPEEEQTESLPEAKEPGTPPEDKEPEEPEPEKQKNLFDF